MNQITLTQPEVLFLIAYTIGLHISGLIVIITLYMRYDEFRRLYFKSLDIIHTLTNKNKENEKV